jgi:hypothetical protein
MKDQALAESDPLRNFPSADKFGLALTLGTSAWPTTVTKPP